jgi:PAS domain S-box-containing protein
MSASLSKTPGQDSDAWVTRTLESIADGLITLDREWRYSFVNDQAEHALGRHRSDLLGKRVWDQFPAILGTEVERELRRAVAEQVPSEYEAYGAPRGRWYHIRVFPIPDGGVAIYFRDVTDRKQTDDKLRQSEALLAEAQQVAHIGSWNWDIANDTIVWSDEHYRICGLKPQEEAITFERGMSFVHPDDRAMTWQIVEQALQDHQPYECCLRLLHPDGTVRIAQSRGQVQYDDEGKPVRMFGTLQDITERKRAEDELKRQKEIFQAIFDHTPLMIRFTDSNARIQLVNRHWENVMGWTLEEAQKQDTWAEVDPADRQRALEFSRQSTGTWADFKVRVRDGRIRVICWASIRLSDDVRIAIGQDVTDRRQEEQTRAAYGSRLQALSRRLVEVQEEERRHLARELHDEIGQMLTGLGFLLAPNGDLPPDAIHVRCAQAQEMVDEVLQRIRELSSDLRPAALDQLGLVAALLTLFERYTNQTKIVVDFRHRLPDKRFAPEVETTAYRIVQEALTNVARHAGVKDATVRVWTTADVLSVQIEDRGRGFDPEVAVATTGSSGLVGMAERVKLLNGHLTVEATPTLGTQITAELPLHRPAQTEESDDRN